MSNYPFNTEFKCPRPPRRLISQNYLIAPLTPRDYFTYAMQALNNDNYRPEGNLNAANQNAGCTIKKDKDKFKVLIDVEHFNPEEVSVKTVDGFIVVEAQHDERSDCNGFISRNLTKRYPLPEGINPDMVVAMLSSDRVLSITAPQYVAPTNSNERVVPIHKTSKIVKKLKYPMI